MKKETYLKLLEQNRKPIKTAYEKRLEQFRREFNPEKIKAATGWISLHQEV